MTEQLSLSTSQARDRLVSMLGDELKHQKPLAQFSTYHTGGPATFFFSCKSIEEIRRTVAAAHETGIDYFLLGGGSNILVSDEGFDGLVIKIDVGGLEVMDGSLIKVGAGESLGDLVEFAAINSLTGLEFASGIAGSVGGAIYGNAGAYGHEISSILIDLAIVDKQGKINTVDGEYCQFAYRHSRLKETGDAVAVARLRLSPGDKTRIRARMDDILAQRASKLPPLEYSAGCFFKNIPDPSQKHGKLAAGKLLEEVGAKGMAVGGAKVYEKHANIIVNTGSATSKDIRQLADILKEKVKAKFGIDLIEEVQQIGNLK